MHGLGAIVVDDYERAIECCTAKLGFTLVEDTPQQGKHWVVVTPNPESDCNLLLARASNERQEGFIGNQCGGRVFLFLQTDDFWRDFNAMKAKGVSLFQEPREEEYGMVIVFKHIRRSLGTLPEQAKLKLWGSGYQCVIGPNTKSVFGSKQVHLIYHFGVPPD